MKIITNLLVISTVALSLWTSHNLSNSFTWSPSLMYHLRISHSAIPSPTSANLNEMIPPTAAGWAPPANEGFEIWKFRVRLVICKGFLLTLKEVVLKRRRFDKLCWDQKIRRTNNYIFELIVDLYYYGYSFRTEKNCLIVAFRLILLQNNTFKLETFPIALVDIFSFGMLKELFGWMKNAFDSDTKRTFDTLRFSIWILVRFVQKFNVSVEMQRKKISGKISNFDC